LVKSLNEVYPIFVCLDTAHLFEVGYSFQDKDEMRALSSSFPIVFQKTRLVHLNDSRTEKGSYLDHHASLGDGFIGAGSLGAVVSVFPEDMFYIAELPKSENERLVENVEILRQIVNGNKNKLDEMKPNCKIERVFYF
jgi:deoxyribonuclease-4